MKNLTPVITVTQYEHWIQYESRLPDLQRLYISTEEDSNNWETNIKAELNKIRELGNTHIAVLECIDSQLKDLFHWATFRGVRQILANVCDQGDDSLTEDMNNRILDDAEAIIMSAFYRIVDEFRDMIILDFTDNPDPFRPEFSKASQRIYSIVADNRIPDRCIQYRYKLNTIGNLFQFLAHPRTLRRIRPYQQNFDLIHVVATVDLLKIYREKRKTRKTGTDMFRAIGRELCRQINTLFNSFEDCDNAIIDLTLLSAIDVGTNEIKMLPPTEYFAALQETKYLQIQELIDDELANDIGAICNLFYSVDEVKCDDTWTDLDWQKAFENMTTGSMFGETVGRHASVKILLSDDYLSDKSKIAHLCTAILSKSSIGLDEITVETVKG